jgi:hypothetical protein
MIGRLAKQKLVKTPEYVRGYADAQSNRGAMVREVIGSSRYLIGYVDGQKNKSSEARLHAQARIIGIICTTAVLLGLGWINLQQGQERKVEQASGTKNYLLQQHERETHSDFSTETVPD